MIIIFTGFLRSFSGFFCNKVIRIIHGPMRFIWYLIILPIFIPYYKFLIEI